MRRMQFALSWSKKVENSFPSHKRQQFVVMIVFTVFFLLISYWYIVVLVWNTNAALLFESHRQTDPKILSILSDKGKVTLDSYTVTNSGKLYGAMGGVPGFPQLILSQRLLDEFSESELEYVLLHEAGHLVRGHMVREILLCAAVISILYSLFQKLKIYDKHIHLQMSIAVSMAIVCAVAMIQVQRMHEYEADMYALMSGVSPQAMISATKKFQAAAGEEMDPSLVRRIFSRGIPYSKRIELAKQYMIVR